MISQILWPDGIFMTKHPKRKQQSSTSDEEQQQEAERRAKFVHELMIGNDLLLHLILLEINDI